MAQFLRLNEAVQLINNETSIALGGMTLYRRPVAFVHALLARENRPQNLTLVNFTAGYESDLLIGTGCIKAIRSVYVGLDVFGFAPMFTQFAQRGEIDIIEETEVSFSLGLRATIHGIGFLPSHAWVGTQLPELRPDVKMIEDPYSDEKLMAFPAIPVDVAVIHALEADHEGNVKINNNYGIDQELIYAAKTVIVTAEKIVENIEKTTNSTIIPAPGADIIVEAPQGALPTSCYPLYPIKGREFMDYVEMCNAGDFDKYLQKCLKKYNP